MKVYLCGPINGCTDEECRDWREMVKASLPETIDPMRRDYRGREAESVRDIVELDKIDVTNSDIILVNYDKPSVGTSMEVLYAWDRGKMVIVVHPPAANLSPWLVYHSHYRFTSFNSAISAIHALQGR
jgi:nucleoside 2-deoxyribosyltransferase